MRLKRVSAVALWLAVTMALLAAMVSGCGSLDGQYVAADRENFNATKSYHDKLKQLSPSDAERLERIDRRRLDRIEAAERNLGTAAVAPVVGP